MDNTETKVKHGTYSGYNTHIANKETPCNDCADAKRAYRRHYKETRLEAYRASQRKYVESHRELVREKNSRWRKANPEYFQSYGHKRRAAERDANHEPWTVTDVITTYGTDCHLCGNPVDLDAPRKIGTEGLEYSLHIDHLVPISKGGDDALRNLRPAHGICNSKKYSN